LTVEENDDKLGCSGVHIDLLCTAILSPARTTPLPPIKTFGEHSNVSLNNGKEHPGPDPVADRTVFPPFPVAIAAILV
jgi:hypothetical protein